MLANELPSICPRKQPAIDAVIGAGLGWVYELALSFGHWKKQRLFERRAL
jgi:hypothetical protein